MDIYKRPHLVSGFLLCISLFFACSQTPQKTLDIQKETFGTLSDGRQAELFIIKHGDGSLLQITNYGATVVTLKLPDKKGVVEDVVLGFDNLQDYERIRGFYGSIVGRFGNRIDEGKFTLDGITYELATNDGDNHLHGGIKGFDRVLWDVEEYGVNDSAFVKLSYLSKDGEEGYPGNLTTVVTYSFSKDKTLSIDYLVTTDQPTIKNITNHAYFNLSGNVKKDILGHELMINADQFLPVDEGLIPTGELRSVEGTPMDFREPTPIGARIDEEYKQLEYGLGYDHNWILNKNDGGLTLACTVYEPQSGRFMEIHTTEPGLQFYSGNFMDGSHKGHEERPYDYRHALVLETQHFPDSPNHEHFPSTVIRPGETYYSTSIYKFGVK